MNPVHPALPHECIFCVTSALAQHRTAGCIHQETGQADSMLQFSIERMKGCGRWSSMIDA
jgi:hypothetical protein